MPKGGRQCSICTHPQAGAIAQMIVKDSGSKADVAVRFNVSESAVQRHRSRCLGLNPKGENPNCPKTRAQQWGAPRTPGATARFETDGRCGACDQLVGDVDESLDAASIKRRAERILHRSEMIVTRAEDSQDFRLALSAIDRCQKSVDTLARISGLIKTDVHVDARQVNVFASWSTEDLWALENLKKALETGAVKADVFQSWLSGRTNTPQALSPGRDQDQGDAA
jgi:hypothetical protein